MDQRVRRIRQPTTPVEVDEDDDSPDNCQRIIDKYIEKIDSPLTAIRAFCIQCTGGYVREVTRCTITKCPLHPFRFAKNPFHGRVGQKAAKGAFGDRKKKSK